MRVAGFAIAVATVAGATNAGAARADDGFDWTGFYLGGHFGLSWGQNNFQDTIGNIEAADFSASGYLGGLQAGYNWQIDSWILGGEVEGSAAHLRNGVFGNFCGGGFGFGGFGFGGLGFGFGGLGGFNPFGCGGFGFGGFVGARVEALGLVTGRAGYTLDRTLLFGKGGLAVAHETYVVNVPGVVSEKPSGQRIGWVVGAGVEHSLTSSWSIKAEYNYIDLGTDRIDVVAASGAAFSFDHAQHIQVAKIGFNYRF
jgi:outer membrane immunogenic protein